MTAFGGCLFEFEAIPRDALGVRDLLGDTTGDDRTDGNDANFVSGFGRCILHVLLFMFMKTLLEETA
jgi:hypothetical protein